MRKFIIFLLPIILVIIGFVLYFKLFPKTPSNDLGRVPNEEGIKIEDRTSLLMNKLRVNKDHTIQLKNVSPNTNDVAFGAISWSSENGLTSLTIIASLPEKNNGQYRAWLQDKESLLLLGNLQFEKAGYIIDYSGSSLSRYTKVVIDWSEKKGDKTGTPVLEGGVSFN